MEYKNLSTFLWIYLEYLYLIFFSKLVTLYSDLLYFQYNSSSVCETYFDDIINKFICLENGFKYFSGIGQIME